MTYTIHRGAAEIGGSCVEVCSASTRIIIDIGMPLMNPDGTSFNSSEIKDMSVDELRGEKILPDIPALYGIADDKQTALLISHAHQDHYGLISFVDKNIPTYLGEATHKLIELTAVFAGKETVINNPHYFKSYEPFIFGDIEITPYLMDHAAFDAYAFLVRAEGKSLLYTGDFRAHGRKWKVFYKFLHIAPKKVDWLLMEGTSLGRKTQKSVTEDQLERQFIKTFRETKGINLVILSGQNIDRLVTIFRACRQSGKLLVIDFYIAVVLSELAALGSRVPFPSPGFSDIKVFFPSLLKKKMERLNRNDLMERFNEYAISIEEIDENSHNAVMTVRQSMDHEIKQIKNLSGGTLIYSMWEGYKESPKTERFLTTLVKRGMTITTIHTSGHADYDTLQKLVSTIEPIKLVAIHTTEGKNYKDFFPTTNVKQVNNGENMEDLSEITQTENTTITDEYKTQLKEMVLFDRIVEIGKAHEKTGALPDNNFEQFIEGENVYSHIKIVCEKLELTPIQAVLFADILNKFEGYYVPIKDVAEYIGCKTPTLINYLDEFRSIEDKNLIGIDNDPGVALSPSSGLSFTFDLETLDSLKKGLLPCNINKNLTIDGFFTQIAILCENRVQRKCRFDKTLRAMNVLLKNNTHLGLVKTLKSYSLNENAELMLLRFCHYFVDLDKDEMDMDTLAKLHDNFATFRIVKQQLQSETHILQIKGLIQNINNDGFGDIETFSLTDKAKDELLFELENQLAQKTIRGITAADTIKEKKLFYPEKTAAQVTELADLLQEKNFTAIQKRLLGEGMRTGFACLFSGSPGTGKTETAYQLARLTGRGIMQIDISDTKSKWFGESEKKIKKVFTQYRTAVKQSALTPILLFNEADGIIGKRQNLGENRTGPGQTENTIQNIILQEIENLNGILIATTNLVQNMDKAFERRFLYKVEFETPTLEVRKSIWQTIIPNLTPDEAATLAEKFDFSGGQIENIARRKTVAEVLSGSPPTLEKLIEYCKEEKQDTQEKRIGF